MNIYGDSCNVEPMSMIFPFRYRTDHFRFSHLSQQFFHQQRAKKKSSEMRDNKHAFNIASGWHAEIDTHPPNIQRSLISDRESFNTNIRQSIKRWKCLVSLGIRFSFTRSIFVSDQDKRDDTELLFIIQHYLYALFQERSRCLSVGNEMLGCIRTSDSTFLSRLSEKKKKKAEGTFAFALE